MTERKKSNKEGKINEIKANQKKKSGTQKEGKKREK